jgi:ATP-binding cassette subfamily B (MDR/TAP) protein 1
MFFTGFIIAFIRGWQLALALSSIVPVIALSGVLMTKCVCPDSVFPLVLKRVGRYMGAYRRQMLEHTADGGTLAEEVISSMRNTHAFGTQRKLEDMYDVYNVHTMKLGIKSAAILSLGLSVMFFWFVPLSACLVSFLSASAEPRTLI